MYLGKEEEMSEIVVYEGSEDWSALYIAGKLDMVADHYLVDERLREHFGVTTIQSDDFLQGGSQRGDVAKTLAEAEAYGSSSAKDHSQAEELEAQAAALLKQAAELRGK